MPHLGFVGPLGAGKTSAAIIFSRLWKNKIEARGGSVKLFSNYDLVGAAEAHGSIIHPDYWKKAVAPTSVYLDVLQELIPKPPRLLIVAPGGKEK